MTVSQRARYQRGIGSGALLLALVATTGCHRDPNKQKQKYLESGKRYEADGKYKEAAIQFSNALKVDRNFAAAHYELGQTYLKMGSVLPGYSELSRAVALQPNNEKARIDLGGLLLAGKEPARAREQAQAVLSFNPKSADAHALLSSVAATQGDRAEALSQIQEALTLDPNRSQFHAALGILQSGDASQSSSAEQQLKQAVSLDPKNVISHLALAGMLERQNDKAGAEAEFKAAVAADPKNALARVNLAQFYQRQGDTANVEATLRQATEELADTPGGADLLQTYYLRTGQFDRGTQAYADLVAKHPKSVPLRLAYARFLLATKNNDKARSIVADLTKSDGSDPDVGVLNGIMLLNDNKVDEAVDALQKTTKNSPDNVAAKLWLGRAAFRKGDLALAQTSFNDAQKLSPGNSEARDGIAEIAMAKHDSGLLAQVAEASIKSNPQSAIGYLWRGMSEMPTHPDQADTDLRQAMKLDPKNWAASLELGALKLHEKKTAEARTLLQQALDQNPNSDRALGLLVSADLMDKQPQKAVSRIQAQLAKSPNNAVMYEQLAEVDMRTDDKAGALAASEKALQLAPSNGTAVMSYSRAEMAQGDTQKAIDAWQNYIKLKPNDAEAYAVLGSMQQTKGDNQAAEASYQKALSLQPDQAVAANNLAYLMVENGQNMDVALSYAQAARRALPNAPSTADTLAWVYYAKGTYSSARDLLEQAVQAAPEDASIQYHLGMTYKKLSDETNASTHLKKAIALAPNSDIAKNAQKALGQAS